MFKKIKHSRKQRLDGQKDSFSQFQPILLLSTNIIKNKESQ
jgi:hypothetical protein